MGGYIDIKSHNREYIYIYISATVHCFLSVSRVSIVRSICLLCFDDSVIFNYSRKMKNSIIVRIGSTFQRYIFIGILMRALVTWLVWINYSLNSCNCNIFFQPINSFSFDFFIISHNFLKIMRIFVFKNILKFSSISY